MICTHRLFNVEHSLYTEQSGRIVSMDEMKKVNNCAFVDAMFDIEGRIQKLNLSREETLHFRCALRHVHWFVQFMFDRMHLFFISFFVNLIERTLEIQGKVYSSIEV